MWQINKYLIFDRWKNLYILLLELNKNDLSISLPFPSLSPFFLSFFLSLSSLSLMKCYSLSYDKVIIRMHTYMLSENGPYMVNIVWLLVSY